MIKDPLILDYNLFKNVSLALGRGVDTALNMAKKNKKSITSLCILGFFMFFNHENRISKLEKNLKNDEK